jgi:hypothetical protein
LPLLQVEVALVGHLRLGAQVRQQVERTLQEPQVVARVRVVQAATVQVVALVGDNLPQVQLSVAVAVVAALTAPLLPVVTALVAKSRLRIPRGK